MPGTAKESNKHGTTTINPNDRQSTQFTCQAPGTIKKASHESSRITPTSASTLHTASTPNPGLHHTHPAGSSLESFEPTQLSSRCTRAQPHFYTDTTHISGYMRHPSSGGSHQHDKLEVRHGRADGGVRGRGKGADERMGGRARECG